MSFDGKLDGLRVDHGALDTAAAGMKRIVDAIDRVLDDLVADLKPLVDQWDGETKLAFHDCERTWNFAMTEMKDLLDKSSQTVYQTNDEFRAVDLKNAANFDF
jgi:early secretory antigenic target protein ESAT-6